jgi:hypothetical protein
MNPLPPPLRRGAAVAVLALTCLALLAPVALADAPVGVPAAVLPAVLPAMDMMDIVANRSRMIQFSIIAVALGIALLWWGQKT